MNKIILIIGLLFTGMVNAQSVNIPDANFKAKLLASSTSVNIATDLSNQLTQIDANDNGEIEFEEAENIRSLNLTNAGIASMEGIEAFVNLYYLECDENLFTSLDISPLIHLENLYTGLNPNLANLILKNGLINFNILPPPPAPPGVGAANFSQCPNLRYVCIDDNRYQEGLLYLQYYYSSVPVILNSYCSFVPGGMYNTITGNVLLDYNNNGCDATDLVSPNLKVNVTDGTNSGSIYTNASGIYNFYNYTGTFTLTPQVENPTYFNVSPPNAVITFPTVNNDTQTQNFCVVANGIHPDLEIVVTPLGVARPGFDSEYKIIYKNKGNQVLNGTVNLTFDDFRTDFVSAIPSVNSQIGNALLWDFSGLLPFETRVIGLVLNINSPVETPAVNSGDILHFICNSNILEDETPDDNTFGLNQIVVNSLDPNDKTCLEGNTITQNEIGKYVHYNINFENTGTASAVNIVVKDTIDTARFDINSLRLLYASHPVQTKITGNVVEFIFENINLPPNNIPPYGGHGNVLFKIKTIPTLLVGDQIVNSANIYFDYNAPIATNEARTTVATLNDTHFIKDQSIVIAPNPTRDNVSIKSKSNIQSIQLFDVEGRLLQTVLEHTKAATLDISNQQNGVYFLKIVTENGTNVEKLIKK